MVWYVFLSHNDRFNMWSAIATVSAWVESRPKGKVKSPCPYVSTSYNMRFVFILSRTFDAVCLEYLWIMDYKQGSDRLSVAMIMKLEETSFTPCATMQKDTFGQCSCRALPAKFRVKKATTTSPLEPILVNKIDDKNVCGHHALPSCCILSLSLSYFLSLSHTHTHLIPTVLVTCDYIDDPGLQKKGI